MEYIKNKNICKPDSRVSADGEKILEIQILNIQKFQVTPIYQKTSQLNKKMGKYI